MAPFSDSLPKPILPIRNRPLIQYQIEMMKSIGIDDIIVLVGHKGFEISRVLGDGSSLGVKIRYVEQTSILGIAHAVGSLEPHIPGPFLLILGDVFFIPLDLGEMVSKYEAQGDGAVLAIKEEHDLEAIRRNFAVQLAPDGRVTRVIEKPRHPPNNLKGVGLYLFSNAIFDAIRRTPRTAMRDEYEITESIQVFIDDGYPVTTAASILDDINLTFPADLLRCNLEHPNGEESVALLGHDNDIHPEAEIVNSVIGSRVRIVHPIRITDSLIFDDCVVDAAGDLDHCVVTPHCIVDCKQGMQIGKLSA